MVIHEHASQEAARPLCHGEGGGSARARRPVRPGMQPGAHAHSCPDAHSFRPAPITAVQIFHARLWAEYTLKKNKCTEQDCLLRCVGEL